MRDLRKNVRFEDFGRVDCPGICMISGVLNDISSCGLKVTFNVPLSIDMEKDYDIIVKLSKFNESPMRLTGAPAWTYAQKNSTQVGFAILYSKDSGRLENYILKLAQDTSDEYNFSDLIPSNDEACIVL